MKENLIYELLDLAVSLAQSQLDGSKLENTLLDLVRKSMEAFEDQTGKALDPQTLQPQSAL
jgi:hypothetical protein